MDEEGNEGETQSLTYNKEFLLIHRVQPTISYKQLSSRVSRSTISGTTNT